MHYLLGYPCDVEGCTEVMKTWTLLIKHKHLHHTKGKVLVMEQNIVELVRFLERDLYVSIYFQNLTPTPTPHPTQ